MPRAKRVITSEIPYHITSRTNNQEWFHLRKEHEVMGLIWEIFIAELAILSQKMELGIHAFVLMSNHYHLVGSFRESYPIGQVMNYFQYQTSRKINRILKRTNHLYGRRYFSSLITGKYHYLNTLKYVYRNPVVAGITQRCSDYPYSTVRRHLVEIPASVEANLPPMSSHVFESPEKSSLNLWATDEHFENWIDRQFASELYQSLKKSVFRQRATFKNCKSILKQMV